MALEPAAENKLLDIMHFSIDHVQELVFADEPSSSQIETAFRNFNAISSINHPIVFAGITHCKMMIVNFVRQGLATVKMCCYNLLQDPHNEERRSKLRKSLDVQQDLCNLQGFPEDPEFAKILDECHSALKNCESAIQEQENLKLKDEFDSYVKAFNLGMNACNAGEILAVSKKAGPDYSATFELFKAKFLVSLRDLVPETIKVTEQLDETDRRLIMRNSKDIFLHGDQHDLKDMVKRLKHDFLTESRDRIHRMPGETIEKRFKRCFDALKKQTVQVVQKKVLAY